MMHRLHHGDYPSITHGEGSWMSYGKAPTFSSTDTTQFKRAIDMTDDELAAIASGAVLTLVPK